MTSDLLEENQDLRKQVEELQNAYNETEELLTIDVLAIALDGNLEPYLITPKLDFFKDVEKWCEIPEENEC